MKFFKSWKKLPPEHKDYFFIYTAAALWAAVYLATIPPAVLHLTDQLIIASWCITAIVGSVIAITGLIVRDNLLLERLGVRFIMVAPLVYFAIQSSLIVYSFIADVSTITAQNRWHLLVLSFLVFLFFNKRRRQLGRRVKIAKASPLDNEGTDHS